MCCHCIVIIRATANACMTVALCSFQGQVVLNAWIVLLWECLVSSVMLESITYVNGQTPDVNCWTSCFRDCLSLEEAEDAVQEAAGCQDELHGLQSHGVALSWQVQGRGAHAHGDAVPLFQLQRAVQQRRQLCQRIAACTASRSVRDVLIGLQDVEFEGKKQYARTFKRCLLSEDRSLVRHYFLTGCQRNWSPCTVPMNGVRACLREGILSALPCNVRGELEGGQDWFPQQDACAGPPACQLKRYIL